MDVKKSGAAKRVLSSRLLGAVLVMLALLIAAVFVANKNKDHLLIGSQTFVYELAKAQVAREKGLSGRDELPQNHAMLFVFQTSSKYCFWMKDMRFPLDMIWLDSQKKVTYIKENASPDTYPESFCPDKDSQYVVEVNAGVAQKTGLKIGDEVSF